MDFLNDCVDVIKMIGDGMANFVDFIINIPSLFKDMLDLLPNPFGSILGVFIGFIIIIILARFVTMCFVK